METDLPDVAIAVEWLQANESRLEGYYILPPAVNMAAEKIIELIDEREKGDPKHVYRDGTSFKFSNTDDMILILEEVRDAKDARINVVVCCQIPFVDLISLATG